MKNLLAYKLILLNTLIIAWLLGTDMQTHWFREMLQHDTTRVTGAILLFFVAVLVMTAGTARETNRAFNRFIPGHVFSQKDAEADVIGSLRFARIEWMEKAAGWMLFLGLIGTLMGLQVSLSGVNTGSVGSLEGIKSMAVQMVSGLRIEISTTIIGALFSLWTEVNYTIIKGATAEVAAQEDEILTRLALEADRENDMGYFEDAFGDEGDEEFAEQKAA